MTESATTTAPTPTEPTPTEPTPTAPHPRPNRSTGAPPPDSAEGSWAIRTKRLGRTFGEHTAVDGLDLTIGHGEIYGFLGPNGAGKSTTVRMLCTLLAPSSGAASVAGYDVATQPHLVRLHLGAALQEAALDPVQTGVELLSLQGRLYGMSRNQARARADELAEMIDIGDALRRPIGTYSGGMKRRLDLAVSLVHRPQVLFLDEPTTGLDPTSRATVWAEVRRLNRELNMTIFLTTQYLEEADALADRVGIISDGRLAAQGTPIELKRSVGTDVIVARVDGDPGDARRVLAQLDDVGNVSIVDDELIAETEDGAAAIGPAAIALGHAGIGIRGLTLRTTTLDDVFLEVTGSRIKPTGSDAEANTPPTNGATR